MKGHEGKKIFLHFVPLCDLRGLLSYLRFSLEELLLQRRRDGIFLDGLDELRQPIQGQLLQLAALLRCRRSRIPGIVLGIVAVPPDAGVGPGDVDALAGQAGIFGDPLHVD